MGVHWSAAAARFQTGLDRQVRLLKEEMIVISLESQFCPKWEVSVDVDLGEG